MEAAEGGSPETVVHNMQSVVSEDDLSPEEQAMQGLPEAGVEEPVPADENDEAAALAEGRIEPPAS